MSLTLPPWTSGHPPIRASPPCAGHPLPANRAPAPKPAGDLAQQIELGWFVFIVLDGQGQHLQCPAQGRVSCPLEAAPWVMAVTAVTPPTGSPAIAPGRGPLPHTARTHARELADFRPGPRNASWDGKGGGRTRGAGLRRAESRRPPRRGGAGRQVVPGLQGPRGGAPPPALGKETAGAPALTAPARPPHSDVVVAGPPCRHVPSELNPGACGSKA